MKQQTDNDANLLLQCERKSHMLKNLSYRGRMRAFFNQHQTATTAQKI